LVELLLVALQLVRSASSPQYDFGKLHLYLSQ